MYNIFNRTSLWCCIIFAGIISCVQASPSTDICIQHQCVAIVDAGSTGSRLHIYAYDLDKNHQPTHIFEHYARRVTPGFASLELEQDIINKYLDELFNHAFNQRMPVYVYATAGMRLRSAVDQNRYFDALRSWFGSKEQFDLKDARTIPGKEEGVFAWLAVNLPLGGLNSDKSSYTGVMDVGGASTQVVFAVTNPINIDPEDLVEFDMYGKKISLFSHSFLGLGIREVSRRFQDQAMCWPNGYPLVGFNKLGQGDAVLCQQTVSEEINAVYNIQGIVRGALSSNPSYSWTVLGAVSAMLKTFTISTNELSLQQLLQHSHDLRCQVAWQDLHGQYPADQDLFSSCLLGSYYYALTVNGYGLAPEQTIHYNSSIQEPDWTLGSVLLLRDLV